MAHSFLLQQGCWSLEGYWLKPNLEPIPLEGEIQISWQPQNWFKMVVDLTTDDESHPQISCQYRGNLNYEEKHYTYVLKHSLLGNIEGEGKIGINSIIQYYWSLDSQQKRRGFETFYCLDKSTYHLTSSIVNGHNLDNTIEATLKR